MIQKAFVILLSVMLLSSGCGKAGTEPRTSAEDRKTTEEAGTESEGTKNDPGAEKESAETGSEPAETEEGSTAPEEPEPLPMEDGRTIRDIANTYLQATRYPMAFGEDYMYFTLEDDVTYRCRYDGSDVSILERNLSDMAFAGGKLWGFYTVNGTSLEEEGLYCLDPETGVMTQVVKNPDIGSSNWVLASGKWLCYAMGSQNGLVIRDMTSGEEKVVSEPYPSNERVEIVEMCLYENTLYAMIGSTVTGEMKYSYSFCSYELGSDAETMTRLMDGTYPGGRSSSIWMEDGLLIIEPDVGSQYYHAGFSDIAGNGDWNWKQEENRVGTDMASAGTQEKLNDTVRDSYNARYLLGNVLLLIQKGKIRYFENMDFSAPAVLWDGGPDEQAYRMAHGIHDGAVYLFVEVKNTSGGEILKISEGGVVEHIPVTLP